MQNYIKIEFLLLLIIGNILKKFFK